MGARNCKTPSEHMECLRKDGIWTAMQTVRGSLYTSLGDIFVCDRDTQRPREGGSWTDQPVSTFGLGGNIYTPK